MTGPAPRGRRPAKRGASKQRVAPLPPTEGGLPLAGSKVLHPPIGMGLWSLGRWNPEDEARTKASIGRALELGIRWLDTAEVYGNGRSERLLGDVLARAAPDRRNPFISTKVSWEHLRPSQVRAALIGSLHRLGRASVDLYLIHGPDPHVPIGQTMEVLASLRAEGKIHLVGVSNFSVDELEAARRALDPVPVVVNQVEYNLLKPEEGDALREYCQRHGILIEAYTPLARGLLAGRYLDRTPPPPEVRRFAQDTFSEDRFPVLQGRARKLRDLADRAGVPMAAIALHWLASRGAVPLFGASRPEQVDAAVEAWSRPPPDSVLAEAEAIARGEHD